MSTNDPAKQRGELEKGDTAKAQYLTLGLQFPDKPALSGKVSVHVVVEDVGEADARATTLFETELTEVAIKPDGSLGPLEVTIPSSAAIKGAVTPAIRVHVDKGATGTLTTGDFINPGIVQFPHAEHAHCNVALIKVT